MGRPFTEPISAGNRPDWVMLGVPTGDGKVVLYASKSLNHAELRAEIDRDDDVLSYGMFDPIRITRHRYVISAETNDFVMIIADDYNAAFTGLFTSWNPNQPGAAPAGEIEARHELPAAPLALPGMQP